MTRRAWGPIVWYYAATPVFVLLDALGGVSVRATALDHAPGVKYLYYAFCLACGVVTTRWPPLAPPVGIAESSVNILLLVLGIMLPYFDAIRAIGEGRPVTNPFTPSVLANFVLSGGVWIAAFYRSSRWMP